MPTSDNITAPTTDSATERSTRRRDGRPGLDSVAAVVVVGLALGCALTWLGTVSDAASALAGGALAGVVLAVQARRATPTRYAAPARPSAHRAQDH